jgi:hypothetical protein
MSLMDDAPPPRSTQPGPDWGGFIVRFAAWLLVFACVFAIFYGITAQPARKPLPPHIAPDMGIHPPGPAPAGSTPAAPQDPLKRYSV